MAAIAPPPHPHPHHHHHPKELELELELPTTPRQEHETPPPDTIAGTSPSTSTNVTVVLNHRATRLLLKAHLLLAVVLVLYGVLVMLVMTPWIQTHVVYAHRIEFFGYNGFEHPENYGLAPGKTVNFRLRAADNTSLGAWFVFSDSFYRTLPFPPSTPSSSSPHQNTTTHLHTSSTPDTDTQRIRAALHHTPTILFLHGNTGTRALPPRTALYTALTSRLRANVLALDYRGFGDSAGHPTVKGVAMDARAAWEWLMEMGAGAGDVLVVGHSLGTAVAGMLGAQLGREEGGAVEGDGKGHGEGKGEGEGGGKGPRGMVLLAPFSSIRLLMDQYYLFGVLPLLKPLAFLPFVPRVLTWSLAHNFDTLTLVPDIKCSVLVAHAEDDWDIGHTHSSVIFNALLDPYLPPSSPPTNTNTNPNTNPDSHSHSHPGTLLPTQTNGTSPRIPWDWHGLTTQQAARAVQRAAVVRRTEIEHFGTLDEFDAPSLEVEGDAKTGTGKGKGKGRRRIALLKTKRGGHDIARMEGVQEVLGKMFGLVDSEGGY